MQDSKLRKHVIDALEFDPSIEATNVGVAVDKGVVTLTGHVSSFAGKSVVEEIVRRVKGVRGIAEEIAVRPALCDATSDDEIAKRALTMIDWNHNVPDQAVQVKVQRGWITLTGEVEWRYQRDIAEQAVRGLSGLTGISNYIEVKPRARVANIKKRIEDAFQRDAELAAHAIRVSVLNDEVTLEGNVKTLFERSAAERAAWSAAGVRSVKDKITVA
jgi:osmotically-inducible protein OsmY